MRQRASGNGIGIVGVWAGSPLSSWAPVNLSSSQNLLGRTVSTPTAALRAQTIVTFHRGLPTQGQQPLYTGGESCIGLCFIVNWSICISDPAGEATVGAQERNPSVLPRARPH